MKIDLQASFSYFIYPFTFDSNLFPSKANLIDTVIWKGRDSRPIKVWDRNKLDDNELLPHVADFLNPLDDRFAAAHLWRLNSQALESSSGGIGGGKHNKKIEWSLMVHKNSISFNIEEIQLALFRIGVGFIVFKASPFQESGMESWLDFIHHFRFGNGQRDVTIKAQNYNSRMSADATPYFPEIAGGLNHHPDGVGTLQDLADGLLDSSEELNGQKWWKDIFIPGQWIPFVSLFVDDLNNDDIPQVLYKARNFFHSKQKVYPSPDDLATNHPFLLSYSHDQWFFFSLDGGGFFAGNPPKTSFFLQTLPDHLSQQYFLLFLITLQQRFTLMMLLDDVASNWLIDDFDVINTTVPKTKEIIFEHIRAKLLAFTARGYYAQAMQREHHHRCYIKWQEIFQLERLYSEVSDEVRYMSDYISNQRQKQISAMENDQRKRTEKLEQKLNLIAWIIGVPAIALSYLNVLGPATPSAALSTLVVGIGVGVFLFIAINYYAAK